MTIMPKITLTTMALFLFTSLAFAQQGNGRARVANMSPENIAERQTKEMTKVLELSEEKAEEVGVINLEYAKRWTEARAEAADNRGNMRETMLAIRSEQLEALGEVLTEEQMTTWKEHQANRRGRGLQKQQKARYQNKRKTDTEG